MVESRELTVESRRGPQSRLGISLTEVLIAMGIMTIGLLGVASVFPVGGWYMQRAEISDRGSAIAQSVMSDLVARGMLNPHAWFTMVPNPSTVSSSSAPNFFYSGVDGKYTNLPQPTKGASVDTTFTRPFAETLAVSLKLNADPNLAPLTLAKQFGSAYVIDPMYVAAVARNSTNNWAIEAYPFPATAYQKFPWPSSQYYGNAGWDSWRASSNAPTGDKTWPIRRVTFQQASGWPLDKALA